jgi:hypothetical protein
MHSSIQYVDCSRSDSQSFWAEPDQHICPSALRDGEWGETATGTSGKFKSNKIVQGAIHVCIPV